MTQDGFQFENVAIALLKEHPRNYKQHPDDQLAHIAQSIKEHGIYHNIIIARDNTILAGRGVVRAAASMGWLSVPAVRLDLDPDEPRALKVMTSDNEISKLGVVDDRALTELLKDIMTVDDLLGTGYDEMSLANLVYVTRSELEVRDKNEAAEWVGMPAYDAGQAKITLTVAFRTEADRDAFIAQSGVGINKKTEHEMNKAWSGWWPPMERQDVTSLRFEE